ncbi:MAG: hypothetical protein IJE48_00280 [Clostridia bacterium]|nr:hypothetical protein [Clostridia bacterium]
MLIRRKFSATKDNCMVLVHHPNQNDVTFCAEMPGRETVARDIVAVKNNGRYLDDMEGGEVKYFLDEKDSGLRKLATINFPDGIPEDYLENLNSYKCEDFIVEYREECIVEVE